MASNLYSTFSSAIARSGFSISESRRFISMTAQLLQNHQLEIKESTISEEKEEIRKPEKHEDSRIEENDSNDEFVNRQTGEVGRPRGPEPTRFGDWEKNGRCSDF